MAEVKMPDSLDERFPGNSNKRKKEIQEAKKEVEPIVEEGQAHIRKKSEGRKIFDTLFNNNDAKSVGSYILYDVLIPAAKDMLYDAVTGGLSMRLFGTERGYSRNPTRPYTNYQGISKQTRVVKNPSREIRRGRTAREKIYNDDIAFTEKYKAYQALDMLLSDIQRTGYATVADLYQYAHIPSDYTDNNYGWTDLSDVRIRNVGGEYVMILPPAEPIDDLPF